MVLNSCQTSHSSSQEVGFIDIFMFRTSIEHYYKSMKKQKSPATTSAGICATPSSLHNMVWSSMWPQTQPGTVASDGRPRFSSGPPGGDLSQGLLGGEDGGGTWTSRAHPQQQRFPIASFDMRPTPARGRGKEARRSQERGGGHDAGASGGGPRHPIFPCATPL